MASVQHVHRPPAEIAEAIKANIALLTDLVTAGREIGVIIDTDLKEMYERGMHRAAGYQSFALYVEEQVGMRSNSIRCVIDRVWRDHQLLTDPSSKEPGTRRREFPRRHGSATLPKRARKPAQAAPAGDGPGDPMVGWLGHILGALDPQAVIDDASDEQLAALRAWVDDFALAGRARGFCEHHPDARSADGKICTECGRQVLR